MGNALRIENLHAPTVAFPDEQLPVVQSTRLSLPEFDEVRHETEARPEGRTRNGLPLELLLEFGDPEVEIARALHRAALSRRPRSDLASPRARREVCVRFGVA